MKNKVTSSENVFTFDEPLALYSSRFRDNATVSMFAEDNRRRNATEQSFCSNNTNRWAEVESIYNAINHTHRNGINTIDLFSGCGGLTLGFKMAGYTSILASDIDENCKTTFQANFPGVPFICGDITQLNRNDFMDITKNQHVDVVLGGPPCQGFSLANKRRNKIADDPRNKLFYQFLKVINWYNPKVFVMENVKGLLSMHNGEVIKAIIQCFQDAGYIVDFQVLTASHYGVPQNRERVIIIGVRQDLNLSPAFPLPSVERPISVNEAIMDLPQIESGQGVDKLGYPCLPNNIYQTMMRDGMTMISNHIAMRHTPRLIERFKAIKPGQSLIDVWDTHGAVKRGNPSEKSTVKFSQNNQRVIGELPAPTIAASFQSNFIHPHLNRNFTAREGARLQSFPDSFIFHGFRTKMSWEKGLSQYQQIGNAVPPLLAYAIGKTIYDNIFLKISNQ